MSINLITLSGHIGKDCQIRDTNNGTMVLFSIAVNKKRGEQDLTFWMNIVKFFKKDQSNKISDYLKKGQFVTIIGELDVVRKDDKEFHQVIADRIELPPRQRTENRQPENDNLPPF